MSAWADAIERTDRAVLANLGSVTVSYQPIGGGPPLTLSGIFDRNQIDVAQMAAGVAKVTPALFVRESDLPEVGDPRDTITITAADDATLVGSLYRVGEARIDGQGGVWLFLYGVAS